MKGNPIIYALDTNNWNEIVEVLDEINREVYAIKVGLEFFMAYGLNGIRDIVSRYPDIKIFLDLKFHDIPNTVVGALKSIVEISNIIFTTIHAAGGQEMIKEAKNFIKSSHASMKLIVVTRLTSLTPDIGITLDGARVALESGADGIVCPAEFCLPIKSQIIKERSDFVIITPGIRLDDSPVHMDDQVATSTPRDAIANGADYLVIGRPITNSQNRVSTIHGILSSIRG